MLTGLAVSVPAAAAAARAAAPAPGRSPGLAADPYSPAAGHPYRLGVVPVIGLMRRMLAWQDRRAGGARAAFPSQLRFGGGTGGTGVVTGPERVYLVFWGSQWGAPGADPAGDLTLAGDPDGVAPYLQRLFRGLGTGGETWSGVMTQYCQGIRSGSASCPPGNAQHVAYPAGGALAGTWADESAAAPAQASGHQLAVEAISAAAHFGNTTAASNRDAQYVIVSPAGTHPDGFGTPWGNFCAWHDWTGDRALSGGPAASPYGGIAFTNLPYIPDLGRACGENFVNPGGAGLLDGVSIVAGHEYAETITDPEPAGGWTDPLGQENADKCAWNEGPGARAADLTLPTGTFAMQATWGNDGASGHGSCEFSHPVVPDGTGGGGGGDTVTVTSPGDQVSAEYGVIRLRIRASDTNPAQPLRYAAAGLPPGLSISPGTGLITGYGRQPGRYTVTVTARDAAGATGSASFAWTITPVA